MRSPRQYPGQTPAYPCILIGNGKCHEKGRWHKTDAFVGKNAFVLVKRDTHIFAVFGAVPNRCRKIMGSGPNPGGEYPLTACLGDPLGNPLEAWSIPRRPGLAPGERLPDMHFPRGLHRLTKKANYRLLPRKHPGITLGNSIGSRTH